MLALKGQRQITMLYVDTPDEAAAAATAGIDEEFATLMEQLPD